VTSRLGTGKSLIFLTVYGDYGPYIIHEEIKSSKNSDPFVCTNYGICNVSAVCALGNYCIMHTTCAL
jgi:hypothetical protein